MKRLLQVLFYVIKNLPIALKCASCENGLYYHMVRYIIYSLSLAYFSTNIIFERRENVNSIII